MQRRWLCSGLGGGGGSTGMPRPSSRWVGQLFSQARTLLVQYLTHVLLCTEAAHAVSQQHLSSLFRKICFEKLPGVTQDVVAHPQKMAHPQRTSPGKRTPDDGTQKKQPIYHVGYTR